MNPRPAPISVERLHAPIFEEAVRRIGSRRVAMVGDQLATDILGARRCGIDAVLVGTGLACAAAGADEVPNFFLPSLDG